MDPLKERFLKNEFLTLSVLGALGRSKTYSPSASEEDKRAFLRAFREKLEEIGNKYVNPILEEEHCSNIEEIASHLATRFSKCLNNGKFRIGIAQKALNLYLKYLWCVGLIPEPPHCPFDSIIINHLPECRDLNWTKIEKIEGYKRLVNAAKKQAADKTIAEWELEIWQAEIDKARQKSFKNFRNRNDIEKNIEKSPEWEKLGRKFHDKLKEVMRPYKNKELKTSRIRNIIKKVPEFREQKQWIYPSDHCINHTNKGACYCAKTKDAIFEKIARGLYRVL